VIALVRPLAGWLRSADLLTARLARAGLTAGLLFTVTVPYSRLLPEYSHAYRDASGVIRDAVTEHQLHNALVFVSEDQWAWKSAFPLNRYPLERSDVIFAKDRGAANTELVRHFPGRAVYTARLVGRRRPEIQPASPDAWPTEP